MDATAVIGQVLQREIGATPDHLPLGKIDGWDSLRMLNMVLVLEQTLGRQLSETEIENLNTVGDVELLLGRR